MFPQITFVCNMSFRCCIAKYPSICWAPSARSSAYFMWKHAALVIVVTWYSADVSWLDALPFQHHMSLVVYVKQDANASRSCAKLPPLAKKHTALCTELPNANGREAHTMAKFVKDHYHALPPVTFFAQDDCVRGDAGVLGNRQECPVMRLADLDAAGMADLMRRVSSDPLTDATCMCMPVVEDFYRSCPHGPIPPDHERCYGDVWYGIEFLRDLAGVPANGTLLRWPGGAHFAAPAHVLRRPGRAFWVAAERLLDGTAPDKAETYGSLMHTTTGINKVWASFEMAHVFERAWFLVLTDTKHL